MSNRSLLFLLLLMLGVFLAVKFDLPTQAKIAVTNLIYGGEMREIGGFRVLAEVSNPEVEKAGLTGESVRGALAAALEKAGIKSLPDELWQKTPGKPSLSLVVLAVKQAGGTYQYTVTIEATKTEAGGDAPAAEKSKTIWSTYEMGEGDVEDIRRNINEVTDVFLKARSHG